MGIKESLGIGRASTKKVRYAVVGAGWISQAVFMPGVEASGNSELTALVTGDVEKARELQDKYRLQRTYGYEQFEAMLADGVADAVYIATPNWEHENYAVRALEAGVHVLLEKPSEVSVDRAERILAAAESARARGIQLMVAYRLHFEAASLDTLRRVRAGEIGEPVFFSSQFSQHVSPRNHRANHGFDAGPVPDMGPYPINAVRNLFGEEPISVSAIGSRHPEATLGDLDDTVAVMLRFPSGKLAQFTVSYAANGFGAYQLVGTKGVLELSPAYTFQGALEQRRTFGDEHPEHEKWKAVDQFAGETRYFSACVLQGRAPEPDAEEALLDVRVIEAIKHALASGQPCTLAPRTRTKRIDTEEQLQKLASRKQPALVNAAAPQNS
jgi:predicted dehydrogenase